MRDQVNKLLDLFVKDIKESSLSVFEKYVAIYNIVVRFKDYNRSDFENENSELNQILFNEYIDCYGVSNFLVELLKRVGIGAVRLDVVTEEHKINHARVLVHLVDPKYEMDQIYIADPSSDMNVNKNHFENAFITPEETDIEYTKLLANESDIFNVKTIDEFLLKIKEFPQAISYFLSVIKIIDESFYQQLADKYNLNGNYEKELYSEIYRYIVSHTNKRITIRQIYDGFREVLRFIYPDLSDYEIDDLVGPMKLYNRFRRSQFFDLESEKDWRKK